MCDPSPAALKAVGSAAAIAFSVTTYHRSLRSFLPDKEAQDVSSSVVYFLWNLLLLSSRLAALALFCSAHPCFGPAHFLCCWLLLLFCVWRAGTDFMESRGGEWLYRGTVALVLYFSWFNVRGGATRRRTLLYHGAALADLLLLCGAWSRDVPPVCAAVATAAVVGVYVLGLMLKLLYYRRFHPNLRTLAPPAADQVDFGGGAEEPEGEGLHLRALAPPTAPPPPRDNKRMRKLAENFYT